VSLQIVFVCQFIHVSVHVGLSTDCVCVSVHPLDFSCPPSQGVFHRSLSLENLLLGVGGQLKISEFGYSKDRNDGMPKSTVGNIEFLPPEVLLGHTQGKAYDGATLGACAFMHRCVGSESNRAVEHSKGPSGAVVCVVLRQMH
jgi:serine/threonine protein kinase